MRSRIVISVIFAAEMKKQIFGFRKWLKECLKIKYTKKKYKKRQRKLCENVITNRGCNFSHLILSKFSQKKKTTPFFYINIM